MIHFNNFSFTYPQASKPAISNITLKIPPGVLTLIVGTSGSGKSTLLRCINGLVPHFSGGTVQGQIIVKGLDPIIATPKVMSRFVGFVFQDPESQFILDRVEDEIAFSMENLAIPREEIHTRVEEIMQLLDINHLRTRQLEQLSGGEKQRVAIASALVLNPEILILDEPTSQLDAQSAKEILQLLVKLNQKLGLTVIVAEHRIERILPFANMLIYLERGKQGALSGSPREVMKSIPLNPPIIQLAKKLNWAPVPITVAEAKPYAEQIQAPHYSSNPSQKKEKNHKEPLIKVENVSFSYEKKIPVINNISLNLFPGEILALLGANGSGKTTLLRTIVGIFEPQNGNIYIEGKTTQGMKTAEICKTISYLPQDPNALLFSDSVLDELMQTLKNRTSKKNQTAEWISNAELRALDLLEELQIQDAALQYPRELSVGQKQRVALGAVAITQPKGILLDEPTRGLDYKAKDILGNILFNWRNKGVAILLVTHDIEFIAKFADRLALIQDGQILESGGPAMIFKHSPDFTPQILSLFPQTDWLKPDDVIAFASETSAT